MGPGLLSPHYVVVSDAHDGTPGEYGRLGYRLQRKQRPVGVPRLLLWCGITILAGNSDFVIGLAILHGEEEISENVEIKDGDSNVQISCTMEPTFPPMAPVMWYPHGNTSWSTDHSAYVLTFNQLHYRDAGDYTCSLAYSDSPLTRRIKIIGT